MGISEKDVYTAQIFYVSLKTCACLFLSQTLDCGPYSSIHITNHAQFLSQGRGAI